MKTGYLLNKFPSLTHTFVLNEITGLIDVGYSVEVISLHKGDDELKPHQLSKYGLDKKTIYLLKENQQYFPPRSSRYKNAIGFKIIFVGIRNLLTNDTLKIKGKIRLFSLCYTRKMGFEYAFRQFSILLELIRVIREKGINHLHLHFASDLVGFAYILFKFLGLPYTFTAHAVDIFVCPHKDLKKWAVCAKKVITISEFNRSYLNTHFNIPFEKVEIVNYCIYVDDIKPVSLYQNEPFKIISISRLVEKKGYPYLIEACHILKKRCVSFTCEIRGDGPQRGELNRLIAEYGLEKEVRIGDPLVHEEALQFISTGSVFVLPCIRAENNDMDGIPNVLMESMAMEIPVISTNVTGIPELIEHGKSGTIVPQKDPESLANAMIKIKEDTEFADKLRREGRKKISQEFNVKHNIWKLIQVFEN